MRSGGCSKSGRLKAGMWGCGMLNQLHTPSDSYGENGVFNANVEFSPSSPSCYVHDSRFEESILQQHQISDAELELNSTFAVQ
ncbi:hypothetical protein J6590_069916 [Homalodisca vitripennis]|nr:hypothetical protein J6590_069916 [Homalodisca vitripennis]